METSSNLNKRETERHSEHVNIMVRLLAPGQENGAASGFMCPLKNISETGVCLHTTKSLEPGQALELWVKTKTPPEAITLYAEVRRSTPEKDGEHFEIGVEIKPESNQCFEKWKRLFG